MDRVVWVGASPRSDAEEIRTVVSSALAVGFGEVVLSKPDESLQRLGRSSPILLKGSTFVLGDAEVGRRATIRSAKDEPLVRAMRGATKHVVVRLEPWKVIPLENLIAYFQGSGTRLLVEVHDAAEAKLVFETMEVGADGIFLTPSSLDEVRAVRALLESFPQNVRLVRSKITSVRSLGLGDRVCVDTCSLLRSGEGMLVGNSSTGLFLIHAETLETGDVDAKGRARSVVVGRVKTERRPLLVVEAEIDDRRYSTIVQNAETVRFVTVDGGSLGVSALRVGSEVLLRVEEGGRHFGMPIRETISEQ